MVEHIAPRGQKSRLVDNLRSPGFWFLLGGLEILFLIHLSESLYPGYSVSANYISDLGVGPMPSSAIFNVAVVLFGLTTLLAAALLRKRNRESRIWLLLVLCGIGAIGVGVFSEDYPLVHRPSAFLAFFFGNLAAMCSYRIVRPPLSYMFAVLGVIGLSALALYGGGVYLDLGVGGMERMILYPAILWAIGFGAYLSAEESRTGRV